MSGVVGTAPTLSEYQEGILMRVRRELPEYRITAATGAAGVFFYCRSTTYPMEYEVTYLVSSAQEYYLGRQDLIDYLVHRLRDGMKYAISGLS